MYNVIGISKQAVNSYDRRNKSFINKLSLLITEAEHLREEHPGCGVEKMYYVLQPSFLGRDKFIEIFMDIGFRVKRFKNYRRTTYSLAYRYPNLIKGLIVKRPSRYGNQILHTYTQMETTTMQCL